MKRQPLIAAVAALALAAGSAGTGAASPGRDDAGLHAVRAFTDQYHSESAAVADGFQPTDECVPGMGYHYINFARLDGRLEPSRPEIILYAPTADGGRQLAGAEWLVIDRDQDLSTADDRPSLFGHDFDGPMPGHAPRSTTTCTPTRGSRTQQAASPPGTPPSPAPNRDARDAEE